MPAKELIAVRLDLLFTVLIFSSYKSAIFKTGERICINQERAALCDALNYYDGIFEEHQVRQYQVPETVEKKITTCIDMITKLNWVAPSPDIDERF